MPGLIGILSKNINDQDGQLLDRMISTIVHEKEYKIDKCICGLFSGARVHLGIFNSEKQPIFNKDRNLCIFMEGEIYGQEIRKPDESYTPQECLSLYEKKGEKFIEELNGGFVIIIYDLKRNKLMVFNDRYGLRPHYYAETEKELIITPEVKAILQNKNITKKINDQSIADFFAFGYILGNKTFLKNIEVLPPASILTYNGINLSIKKYWDFHYEADYNRSENEFIEDLTVSFKNALGRRLKKSFHFGVTLSGGLDSRLTLAMIAKEKKINKITAFTYGSLNCSEVKIAKKVAKNVGAEHMTLRITPEMIIENAKKEVSRTDGMDYIGVSYILPIYKSIGEKTDVILDATELNLKLGGDHLYLANNCVKKEDLIANIYKGRYFSDEDFSKCFTNNYYNRLKNLPFLSLKDEFDKIKGDDSLSNECDHFFLQNYVRRCNIGEGHVLIRSVAEESLFTFDNELIDLIMKIPPEFRQSHRIYRNFFIKLSPELARIPYDHTGVSVSLPLSFWVIGKKYLGYKEGIKRKVRNISRNKISLSNKRSYVNFEGWLYANKIWQNYFKELLLSKTTLSTKEYIDPDYIKRLFEEHLRGKKDNAKKILYLATFELFLRSLS